MPATVPMCALIVARHVIDLADHRPSAPLRTQALAGSCSESIGAGHVQGEG